MPEPLRIGLVGGGFIGGVVGAQFFDNPDARVAALADPSEAAREEIATRFDLSSGALYTSYGAMLANEALDAVSIGTPHALHHDQILAALDDDLHVFCDKPLTVDLDSAREIAERTERSDRTVMVGYQRHLDPAFVAGRERWHDREPDCLTAEITQDWVTANEGTWRLDPDTSGGGFLYDTGSHLLDIVLWMVGLEPVSVAADMSFADDAARVDERARLSLDFTNGATATITTHGGACSHQEAIHVWDDEGATYFESSQWGSPEVTEIDAAGGRYTPHYDRFDTRTKGDAFVESIREGTEPPATVRDAFAVTAVTEAAYESARTGERVSIDRR
ncbi:Gfo/Idh/MocA family protein [Halococcus agarilyticus]|uniref:Gfo/Idh/MocA family protein n=1 Tax=Halococcus agarilyticus TaxID=1232219 RepID=UPI000677823E|nr:Gfo/Idh/MocA family oxidoreductase [Halococcus agarilyticus]